MTENKNARGELVLFEAADGGIELDVRLEAESVWLSQRQMSELFDKDVRTISEHIQNLYAEGELGNAGTIRKFRTVRLEGRRKVERNIDHYNLDVTISVGYRVKSQRGVRFRQWATSVLREHLISGYTVHENRLRNLNKAVRLIAATVDRSDLSGDEARALLHVVGDYSRALDLIDDYDHQRVGGITVGRQAAYILSYEEALEMVEELRRRFSESQVFGVEKDKGLASALGAVMQTAGGEDVYPSLEEKAAHLLYFLVKNHAFVDGNKRIAAALFLCFLERNGILLTEDGSKLVSDAALVAITLMIAESRREEKEVIVRILTHLLADESVSED